MKFVGRQRELEILDDFYHGHRAALMILYGRRRVGKTSLLSHWLDLRKISNALFWTATTHSAAYQLRDFSQTLIRFDPRFGSPPTEDFSFRDWEATLEHLAEIAARAETPLVIVIDEFTHLLQSDPPLVSVVQKVWDHRLSKLPSFRLILTGSLIGVMEQEVLSIRAPLYGRAAKLLKLRPLPFGALKELFPTWSPAERVAAYAVCGGIPAYLDLFVEAGQFTAGLRAGLAPGSLMLTDSALLLHDQLKEPYVYESVLASIASGFHVWTDIAKMAGIGESSLGFYLKGLQALELVERRDPLLSPPTGRKSRYYICDSFLRFYYRFILRNITAIERGNLNPVLRTFNDDLRGFIGRYVFEELCRDWVFSPKGLERLGFSPEVVGSFWTQNRGQAVQLDVVAANSREKQLFIGEAKWAPGSLSRTVLTDLVARSQRMPQVAEGWQASYGLFTRDGFTGATKETARGIKAILVNLVHLEANLVEAAARGPGLPLGEIEF